jgi:putative DNA-invertase from lambdoid prophage Rac
VRRVLRPRFTHDEQTIGLQFGTMTTETRNRGWDLARQVKDVGSGAKGRCERGSLLKAARRREIDVVVARRLDRSVRQAVDLVPTLRAPTDLNVGVLYSTEALNLTTPTRRAMAALLAVFAEFEREVLRERVRAGFAQARREGRPHGRRR